jgi:hypothetical protein
MIKDQLEFSLGKTGPGNVTVQRQRRLRRARWWFEQMREVVDRALDRSPAPLPSAEQIYFPLRREPQVD